MTSVGIDVSTGKSTVCILIPYGEVIASPYEIQHTEPKIRELVSRIKSIEGSGNHFNTNVGACNHFA